ncbi:MAG: ferredoxin--NADP(+) reductase [Rhodospirillaceae bacterium TMED8]|nr:ferredoxin--NADP(+) reductase [Magnetovibrio sp.]OUT48074.1 MAG: ferredoxin--NADP(+) reductase [Rhodospirillaceae bacterium TMED8]
MKSPVLTNQDKPIPASLTHETVLSVHHWTDKLFSFRISRPQAFRFRSGEFVMLGLFAEGVPLLRAYSMTSPSWDDTLEFYSIKVPHGPLTSQLQHIKPGDKLLLGKKATGTLSLDSLTPSKSLYLFSTGTGFAPFASLIRDPETYDKFERVILTHTCRAVDELAFGKSILTALKTDPLVGELTNNCLLYFDSVTQEPYRRVGRITKFIENETLSNIIGQPPISQNSTRAMICGSIEMTQDMSTVLKKLGLSAGSAAKPADFVVERAFVD